MKILLIFVILISAFVCEAFAQSPPQMQGPQLTPEVQQLSNQLSEVGCRAQNITAAQTIDQLQKQVAELQKRISDPPKPAPSVEMTPMSEPSPISGATKH